MMFMPDGNMLIALKHAQHESHTKASAFFSKNPKVATCPITELNLVRVLMQLNYTGTQADTLLQDFVTNHRAKFVPADISATEIAGLNAGHRTTTDSYLVMLTNKHGLKLATLDEPLANRFPGAWNTSVKSSRFLFIANEAAESTQARRLGAANLHRPKICPRGGEVKEAAWV